MPTCKSYFDTIPHERLMQQVEDAGQRWTRSANCIQRWLETGHPVGYGMQRGGRPPEARRKARSISPLLANLYLHPLDVLLAEHGLSMVRYADDFVVLCDSAEKAREALALIRAFVDTNGLTLHPDKTHVGDCRIIGQGFEFLGYRFEAGRRLVRKKSTAVALVDKIRAKTRRTSESVPRSA